MGVPTPRSAAGQADPAVDLAFAVDGAHVVEYAAGPTLGFMLRIERVGGGPVRSLALNTQIRIAATRRSYDAATQERLVELFGRPEQWGRSLRSMLWTNVSVNVPPFTDSTVFELQVPCTYDLEVASAKYFYALEDGEVPLELLFSGTVFHGDADGALRVALIAWDKEAQFRLPVGVWKEMMGTYFPNSAWLRLRKDSFDRLYAYKARNALTSWEEALDTLLPPDGEQEAGDEAKG